MDTFKTIGLLFLLLSISYDIANAARLPNHPLFVINKIEAAETSTTLLSTATESTAQSFQTSTTSAPPSTTTETTPKPTITTTEPSTTTVAPSSTTTETTPKPTITTTEPSTTTVAPSSTTTETTPKPTITTTEPSTTTVAPSSITTETTPKPTITTTEPSTTTVAPPSTTTETTPKPTITTTEPSTTTVAPPSTTTETTPKPTITTTEPSTTTVAPSSITTETTPKPTRTSTTVPSTTPTETTPRPTEPSTTTVAPSSTTTETTPKPTITTTEPSTTTVASPSTTTETTPKPTITTTEPSTTTVAPPSTTTETTPKPTSTSTTVTSTTPTETTPRPIEPSTTTVAPSSTTTETTPKPTSTSTTVPSTTPTETTPRPTTTTTVAPSPTPTSTLPPTTTEEPIENEQKPCILRDYGYNSYVCVCNATYCDTLPSIEPLPEGEFEIYSSNRVGRRFFKEHGYFQHNRDDDEPVPALIYINPQVRYQPINGFGSAVTDAAGVNINSLKSGARRNLLRSYFSKAGIEYSLVQVPLGSTDFSTHPYTYNDGKEDPKLKNFKLAPEDYEVKIPLIKEAQALQSNLTLLASPWAAPAWMKTNGEIGGSGILKAPMYQPWANYLIKFLEAYKEQNLEFWGITTGNQPNKGRESTPVPSLGWLGSQQGVWVAKNLGPTLQKSPFKDVNLLAVDDTRNHFPVYADLMFLSNEVAKQFVDGFGVQWHDNVKTPSSALSETHKKYQDKLILTTSARAGPKPPVSKDVQLGVWDHAEEYIHNIIEDINNWSTGWVDSNLALDLKGGPSFILNHNVEAPIIVNSAAEEFYKQPIFYAQGHVSKFVPIGSERIGVTKLLTEIDVTGFRRPDGGIVVVIFNEDIIEQPIQINDVRRGQIHFNAAPRSISTVVYW